ncbi:hypothetical protein J3R82DRAFT_4773 [Butyriboletus roseoflavus]|nr:hypothetical protein J3R82DRAFT_4773 [Butyriboletus roseoflavus]
MDLRTDDSILRVRGRERPPLGHNYNLLCRNAINALSFSFDGEYLAIASTGSYIDIVRDSSLLYLGCRFNLATFDLVRDRDEYPAASRAGSSAVTDSYLASVEIRFCVLWADEAKRRQSSSSRCDQLIRRWYIIIAWS